MLISIILPAYQEAKNLINIIPVLIDVLKGMSVSYEILVIDTMIPMDNTEDVCRQFEHCFYIPRENGNAYGDAIRTGFAKSTGDYVVVMDADGSHNPEDIARFYKKISRENFDLIIGSRYCVGGSTDNGFILRLMSRILNFSYKIMFGLKVNDVSDSFRMYKGIQVRELKLECNNFDVVEEILILLNYSIPKFKTFEIPISFNKRVAGQSKRNLIRFIKSYLQTMYRLMRIKNRVIKRGKI